MAVYAYAIQIYADFSAYTDIAIGVAALLGYRFPQNFNQPYRALGIGDFWRRWHMTLSRWLRDYLYIPLGGNRHGALATARNLMLTMVLGGLWHGANWTFLIWGAMHGVGAGRRSRLAAQRRLRALGPGAGRARRRLGADLQFRLPRLAVLPRAVARRGRPVPRRRLDRQRRGLDHAGGGAAADRLRRADPDRAAAARAPRSASCSTTAARSPRRRSASSCSMRSSSWRRRRRRRSSTSSSRGEPPMAEPRAKPPSSTSPWAWLRVLLRRAGADRLRVPGRDGRLARRTQRQRLAVGPARSRPRHRRRLRRGRRQGRRGSGCAAGSPRRSATPTLRAARSTRALGRRGFRGYQ